MVALQSQSVRLRNRCVASDPSVEAMEHIATPPPLQHNAVYSLPMRTSPGTYSKRGVAHAFGKICRLQGACKRTALRGCWVQIQPSRALNCPLGGPVVGHIVRPYSVRMCRYPAALWSRRVCPWARISLRGFGAKTSTNFFLFSAHLAFSRVRCTSHAGMGVHLSNRRPV